MTNIVTLSTDTCLDIPVERVLDGTPRDLSECLVIGLDADGDLYMAFSTGDAGQVLLLLEMTKAEVLGSLSKPA